MGAHTRAPILDGLLNFLMKPPLEGASKMSLVSSSSHLHRHLVSPPPPGTVPLCCPSSPPLPTLRHPSPPRPPAPRRPRWSGELAKATKSRSSSSLSLALWGHPQRHHQVLGRALPPWPEGRSSSSLRLAQDNPLFCLHMS
jgi:hypothetical protein